LIRPQPLISEQVLTHQNTCVTKKAGLKVI
jgi:hypothetical protein